MQLNLIIPTHNFLRVPDKLIFFRNRFINNEGWIERKKKILILEIDGQFYLNDGHHEVCGAHYAGETNIPPEVFDLYKLTIEDMLKINFDIGWVTPYNPVTHVRTENFMDYKNIAVKLRCRKFVEENKYRYIQPRLINSIKELYRIYVKI